MTRDTKIAGLNKEPLSLKLYAGLTAGLTPILHISSPLLKKYGGFKDSVPERLGQFSPVLDEFVQNSQNHPSIWIHAVSVGEAAVAGPVMDAIKCRRQDIKIVLSTTTFTGRDYILKNLKPDALFFFPLDLPDVMNRLVEKLKPDCFIDVEVELWPNCFRALKNENILMVLVNGRISDRAMKPPLIVRELKRWLFGCFDALFMRSPEDVERAIALGAPASRTYLAGNLKFAAAGSPLAEEEREKIRTMMGIKNSAKLLVAGSTHPGEDEKVIEAWKMLNNGLLPSSIGPVHLIIAPRHLEQVNRIIGLLNRSSGKIFKWTQIRESSVPLEASAVVVDTIGELMKLYGAADAAFVGGSLIPRGGHNILEPVAMGVPTVHGPSMANFHDLVRALKKADLIAQVENSEDLARAVVRIYTELDLPAYRRRAMELISNEQQAPSIIGDFIASNLPG